MRSLLPIAWWYDVMPDPLARLGPTTTLVVRRDGEDFSVLGICPGPELATRFLESLAEKPHESLFKEPTCVPAAKSS